MKKSEARILVFLNTVANVEKKGSCIAERLKIDYIYVMKLLRGMYEKGWVKSHMYNFVAYYEIRDITPLKEAKQILTDEQKRL